MQEMNTRWLCPGHEYLKTLSLNNTTAEIAFETLFSLNDATTGSTLRHLRRTTRSAQRHI